MGKVDKSFTKQRLHNKQQEVNYAIAIEMYNWSSYQDKSIYYMWFNTKEVWNSVKIIYGGDTSHHRNLTIVRMQLPDGNTAITDNKNASLLGPQFAKVFCTDFPVEWSALDEARQRGVMQDVYQPI